ncbi:hypothetical protein KC329_g2 [Hortaea werneckii]|nr:hypothetical protein KC329_g2 [Hortaea werneckii]
MTAARRTIPPPAARTERGPSSAKYVQTHTQDNEGLEEDSPIHSAPARPQRTASRPHPDHRPRTSAVSCAAPARSDDSRRFLTASMRSAGSGSLVGERMCVSGLLMSMEEGWRLCPLRFGWPVGDVTALLEGEGLGLRCEAVRART